MDKPGFIMRWLLCGMIAILLAACSMPAATPEELMATPTEKATQSSATVTVTIAQTAATPTTGSRVIEYPEYGFRFTLPLGLQIVEQSVLGSLRLFLGIALSDLTPQSSELPPIGLRVFEKLQSVNLIDWFDQNQGGCYERGTTPPPDHYFIDPNVDNQEQFKGFPSLHYESGCWPIPEEQVTDRGRLVIALYHLKDYLQDYQDSYQQILGSLEFFEPTSGPVGSELLPTLTATPPACLDQAVQPQEVPARQTPLEVRFTSDGNLYAWVEGEGEAKQISDTGDAQMFSFAPDGQVIAFTRGQQFDQTELWSIRRDGSGLRLLLSADQLHQMRGAPEHPEFEYYDNAQAIQWLPGSHTLGFKVVRNYKAEGGSQEAGDFWQINVDTGNLARWTPPAAVANPPEGLVSPDGRQIAIKGDTSLTLVDADGANRRENVLTYPHVSFGGPGQVGAGAQIFWAADSQSLAAITFTEDLFSDLATFTTWRVPVNGSPAIKLATFTGLPWSFTFYAGVSQASDYIAYLRMNGPNSNDLTLHLATFDGTGDIAYARGEMLRFFGWAPDGVHFLFGQATTNAMQWGSLCGGSQSLLDPQVVSVRDIQWVDATHFVFAKGLWVDPTAELRLGEVGGGSILIGPYNGQSSQYQIVPDEPK